MDPLISFGPFGPLDATAVGLLLLQWFVIGRLIEHPPAGFPSVSHLMQAHRQEWMRQFVTRQPRIFDATMIDNLRQGTAFFASTSLIAIGGGIAMLGNPAGLLLIARDWSAPTENAAYQLQILLVVAFLANGLLKFIWAHRLFGYCAILMAAVPNDPLDPMAAHRAAQAGDINICAGRGFNRGLRSIYYALGSLGWLFGPEALIATTLVTTGLLIRREFGSNSRQILLRDM